uniref:Microcephalin 1 n=1 Tax=Varanus komodoensis TaxID=61221 RepID=A0A8D2IMA5_VARKO
IESIHLIIDLPFLLRTENYSETFIQQLLDMGAKVSKTFNKQVTHVIFKDGLSSTWNKAQKVGVKVVSVLWVEKCRELGAHVDESLYPAINTNEGLPQLNKKHKCMQPKNFIEKTPENDKRLQKKLEIMAKELAVQKAATETDIPVLLFEDDGSLVYSPVTKIKYQCSAMERRVKEMKEKRENLSPTGMLARICERIKTFFNAVAVLVLQLFYHTIFSQKRKRETENDGNAENNDNVQPLQSQREESVALNYNSKRAKRDRVETPDCLLNLNSKEQICATSVNRCSPTTGKLLLEHGKQNLVVQVVKKLGGFLFSDEVCESTSHVVAGAPRRTLNVLMGMARGCWIVCYEWVLWSLEYGQWISEEPYELSVDFPAAPICRFQLNLPNRKGHLKLFSDQPIMFISCFSQPPCEKLSELVQLFGGKVCKTLRQAKICIGKCKVGKHTDIQCLSEKWILDSITHHKICPLESYIFQTKL